MVTRQEEINVNFTSDAYFANIGKELAEKISNISSSHSLNYKNKKFPGIITSPLWHELFWNMRSN